jgi:hypothetical protein
VIPEASLVANGRIKAWANVSLSPLIPAPPLPGTASTQDVVCRERLGGLLKHYYHAAA